MSPNNRNLIFSIKKVKNQKKWTREEDELLIVLAQKFNEKHWKDISKRFLKKNSLQCFSRYKRIRPGIIKGSWKKEEDLAIISLVEQHGKSWSKISKIFNSRNGKQIRDRFINVLDPEIRKGKFTDEEDLKLVALFQELGPKWASIATFFPSRTADMIKNRFHSSIKKRMNSNGETCIDESYYNINHLNKEKIYSKPEKEFTLNTKNETEASLINLQLFNDTNNSNNLQILKQQDKYYTSKFDSYGYSSSPVSDLNGYSTFSVKEQECIYNPERSNEYSYNNNNKRNYNEEIKIDSLYGHNAWNFDDFFTV